MMLSVHSQHSNFSFEVVSQDQIETRLNQVCMPGVDFTVIANNYCTVHGINTSAVLSFTMH